MSKQAEQVYFWDVASELDMAWREPPPRIPTQFDYAVYVLHCLVAQLRDPRTHRRRTRTGLRRLY